MSDSESPPPRSVLPPTSEAELAARVQQVLAPGFDLDREIGRGGMGIVYRAVDRRLKRPVAVKVLPPDLAFRSEIRTRFLHEAEMAARLTHPNIVPIFSVDERDGLVYFIMAFVDGETLAQRLKATGGTLSVAEAERILREIASALAYAHAHGLVHRDIKPDNILLASDGDRVLVTDFGIARAVSSGMDSRLTATGVAIGTPAYMSPEQCAGDREIDGRSDLYSLGVVGYQMLCGTPPFTGTNTATLLVKQLSEAPVPIGDRCPNVPQALAAIIMRLLAKSPENRFPNAGAVVQALDAAVANPGQSVAASSIAASGTSARPAPAGASAGRITGAADVSPGRPPGVPASYAPLPYPAPAPPLSRRDQKRLDREQRRRDKRGEDIQDSDPRDVKIRKFRKLVASMGGMMIFLSAMSVVTSPHFFWAIFPDLGMGLAILQGAGRLWADGISPVAALSSEISPPSHLPAPPPVAPSPYPLPAAPGAPRPATPIPQARPVSVAVPSAGNLAPAAVLAGPYGDAVRRAALDRDRVQDLLKHLDAADRATVPNAGPTADGLAKQIGTLAAALHRIDVETPPAQRSALADRRRVFVEKLESAGMMLQTLYFDLLRLHMSSASSGADGVASVTEQASALSRDIGYLLGAADELRTL